MQKVQEHNIDHPDADNLVIQGHDVVRSARNLLGHSGVRIVENDPEYKDTYAEIYVDKPAKKLLWEGREILQTAQGLDKDLVLIELVEGYAHVDPGEAAGLIGQIQNRAAKLEALAKYGGITNNLSAISNARNLAKDTDDFAVVAYYGHDRESSDKAAKKANDIEQLVQLAALGSPAALKKAIGYYTADIPFYEKSKNPNAFYIRNIEDELKRKLIDISETQGGLVKTPPEWGYSKPKAIYRILEPSLLNRTIQTVGGSSDTMYERYARGKSMPAQFKALANYYSAKLPEKSEELIAECKNNPADRMAYAPQSADITEVSFPKINNIRMLAIACAIKEKALSLDEAQTT